SGKNYLAALTGSPGSQTWTVTGSAAGNWFALEVTDVTALSSGMTHTGDPTADLTAIQLAADPSFYGLVTIYNSSAYVLAAAAWAEANGITYNADVPDTAAIQTASGNGDTLDA